MNILAHFQKVDPIMYGVLRSVDISQWLKPHTGSYSKMYYFQSLCRQIISQQLSGKAADSIQRRVEALFPEKKIAPKKLLEFEDQVLRDAGMSFAKAKYLKNIATEILGNTIHWESFETLSDQEVIKELTTINGVGTWTSEMFLMFTLRREDIFSYGDLGLRRGIEKLYNLKDPTQKETASIVAPWKPYRTYGSIGLWWSLEK